LNGDRLKIAVFVDFDNIEIGVKSTLNRHFDIGAVLEAIKERGEVVTKVAYGDWKRAGEHSRSMTQHAIQMVQRNLTPGGDKNGADINLALDALEMAFTRNHINAFVIVGGDSDFIALVEKLKQYDKKVMVVGGRSFTSIILQKNCHEFIAYENLIAPQGVPQRRPTAAEKSKAPVTDPNLQKAVPLVRRALKVLADREVSPQLGLLKSTLLQLDSTFSERDYSASTFRDFIEKMAAAGFVNLKQVDRSLLVELKDQSLGDEVEKEAPPAVLVSPVAPLPSPLPMPLPFVESQPPAQSQVAPVVEASPERMEEGIRAMQDVFQNPKITPHWPMYLRNVKQFIKNAAPTFDERQYGFVSFLEAVRAAQRSGVFRLERNRQGILRVYPGNSIPQPTRMPMPLQSDEARMQEDVGQMSEEQVSETPPEQIGESADVQEMQAAAADMVGVSEETPQAEASAEKPARKKRASAGIKRKPAPSNRAKTAATPAAPKRTRKKPATEEEA
jgi:uncharacterized LabA/DUF88 family protein